MPGSLGCPRVEAYEQNGATTASRDFAREMLDCKTRPWILDPGSFRLPTTCDGYFG